MSALPSRTRTMLWRGPGLPLTVEDTPSPRIDDPHDVIIRVRAAVFGAALVRAARIGHPRLIPPKVLGTLVAGDVVATGPAIRDLPIGTPITADPHPPCGRCEPCRVHVPALCTAQPKLDPGGLSEYVRFRPPLTDHLHQIPDGISYAAAAYAEIVACVAESISVGGVGFGDTVAVVGCGPVGLLQIQLAKLRGAARVIGLFNHDAREAAIAAAGAIPLDVRDMRAGSIEARLRRMNGGRGADVVLEAVGRAETYALALRLVRPGGTVVGFGGCASNTRSAFDPNDIHYNGIRFIGSYHYAPGTFERVLRLLASRKSDIDVERLFTHRLPLARIAEAPDVASGPDCIALIIEP